MDNIKTIEVLFRRFFFVFLNLSIFSAIKLNGQDFYNTLNFTNPVLYNPSNAGLSGGTVGFTSNNTFFSGGDDLFNEFSFTLDTYSEKISGGAGFIYKQSLKGNNNLNSSEIGVIYAPRFNFRNGDIIPSLYIGYEKSVKNLFVYLLDEMLNRDFISPNPPGKAFQRFDAIRPGIGILWDTPSNRIGFSGQLNFVKNLSGEAEINKIPPRIIASYSKKLSGKKNGLLSNPYQAIPEVILHFENNRFQSRIALKIEQKSHFISLLSQNNFSDNFHAIGGTYGLNLGGLHFFFTNAIGLPAISSQIIYSGEISLGIYINRKGFNLNYPFAPMNNRY